MNNKVNKTIGSSLNYIIYGTQASVCRHIHIGKDVDSEVEQAKMQKEIAQLLIGDFFQEESSDVKDNLYDFKEEMVKVDANKEDGMFGTPKTTKKPDSVRESGINRDADYIKEIKKHT